MASADIDINIVAKQALSSLKQIEQNTKRSESRFKTLGLAVVAINQAFELASKVWRKFRGAIVDVIKHAGIQQKAMNDLKFAFRSAGQESDQAAEDFAKFAAELQKVTTFGDEVTMSAAALFTQLTKVTGEGLEQATIAGANLASTLGISLDQAMRMLAKTTTDGGSGLRRYGIEVKAGATEAETLANAVNAVNDTMGGRAQAEMDTFIGLQKALGNAWGDLKEEIGFLIIENELLISVMRGLVVQLQAIPVYVQEINRWFGENIEYLKITAMALGLVGAAYAAYTIYVNKAAIATKVLTAAKVVLNALFVASPIGLVVTAVAALGVGIFNLAKHYDLVTAQLRRFTGYIIETSVPAIRFLLQNIIRVVGIFKKDWAEAIQETLDNLEEFGREMNERANDELDMIREQNELKRDEEQKHQEEISAIKTDAHEVNTDMFKNANEERKKNNDSFFDAIQEKARVHHAWEKQTNEERIKNFDETMGRISTLAESENRVLSAIGKSAAITQATIDGVVAVQKTLASMPFPFNIPLAAAVGVATAANVAKIAGVPLAEGGVVMPRAGGTSAVIGEAGRPEAVIPLGDRRAQEQMQGIGGVNITIQGNVIGDDENIENLARKLSDAVRFRNVELVASGA